MKRTLSIILAVFMVLSSIATLFVASAEETEAEIVDAAFALEKGKALEGSKTLTGVVSGIVTEYSSEYKNVTVNMTVKNSAGEDKTIQCYRMKGDDAATVEVGDTIKVTGTIKNYNGTIEFDNGCTFVTVKKVSGDYAIKTFAGYASGDVSILVRQGDKKTIEALTTKDYNAYALIICDANGKVQALDLRGPGRPAGVKGDAEIPEGGFIIGINRDVAGYPLENVSEAFTAKNIEVGSRIKLFGVDLVALATTAAGTALTNASFSVLPRLPETQKEILDAAFALKDGERLEGTYSLTGVVTKKTDTNSQVNITVGGKDILCYKMNADDFKKFAVGDTITVNGIIKNYKNTVEFDTGCKAAVVTSYPEALWEIFDATKSTFVDGINQGKFQGADSDCGNAYSYVYATDKDNVYFAIATNYAGIGTAASYGNGTGTNLRLWFRTNDEATVYTHFVDVSYDGDAEPTIGAKKCGDLHANKNAAAVATTGAVAEAVASESGLFMQVKVPLTVIEATADFGAFVTVSNGKADGIDNNCIIHPVGAAGQFSKDETTLDLTKNNTYFPYTSWNDAAIKIGLTDYLINTNAFDGVEPIKVTAENGRWQNPKDPALLTYTLELADDGKDLYVRVVGDGKFAEEISTFRFWIRSNDEATVYTHFYDVDIAADGKVTNKAKYNTSTTSNSGDNIASSGMEFAAKGTADDKTLIVFKVPLAEFNGAEGFAYYAALMKKDVDYSYYPAPEGTDTSTMPYKAWDVENEGLYKKVHPITENVFDLGEVKPINGITFTPDKADGLTDAHVLISVDGKDYYDMNNGGAVAVASGKVSPNFASRGIFNARYIKVTGTPDVHGTIETVAGDAAKAINPEGPYTFKNAANEQGYGIKLFESGTVDTNGTKDTAGWNIAGSQLVIANKVANGVYKIIANSVNAWPSGGHADITSAIEGISIADGVITLAENQVALAIMSSGGYATAGDGEFSNAKHITRGLKTNGYFRIEGEALTLHVSQPEEVKVVSATIDGKLDEDFWKDVEFTKVDGMTVGTWQNKVSGFTYEYALVEKDGYVTIAVKADKKEMTQLRVWFHTNPEAALYTHFFDVFLNGDPGGLKANPSLTENKAPKEYDTTKLEAAYDADKQIVEARVKLADIGATTLGPNDYNIQFGDGNNLFSRDLLLGNFTIGDKVVGSAYMPWVNWFDGEIPTYAGLIPKTNHWTLTPIGTDYVKYYYVDDALYVVDEAQWPYMTHLYPADDVQTYDIEGNNLRYNFSITNGTASIRLIFKTADGTVQYMMTNTALGLTADQYIPSNGDFKATSCSGVISLKDLVESKQLYQNSDFPAAAIQDGKITFAGLEIFAIGGATVVINELAVEPEPEPAPSGKYPIKTFAGYASGDVALFLRQEGKKALQDFTTKDYNAYALIIVGADGIVSELDLRGPGRPAGVKGDVEVPEGGYIIAINRDVTGYPIELVNEAFTATGIKVGDGIDLYGIDLEATAASANAYDQLANVTFDVVSYDEVPEGANRIDGAQDWDADLCIIYTRLATGEKTLGEVTAVTTSGAKDNLWWNAIVVDAEGKVVKFIGTNIDKTNEEIPEGGFIICTHGSAAAHSVLPSIEIGSKITLYNCDLEAFANLKKGLALKKAAFTVTAPEIERPLSFEKSYTATENTRSDAHKDDGKKLTDGKVTASAGGGTYAGWGNRTVEGQAVPTDVEVIVDLGDVYAVDKFDIHAAGGAWGITIIDGFTVAVSEDGTNYNAIEATSVAGEDEKVDSWVARYYTIALDKPVSARYVKFLPIKHEGTQFTWIDEVEVWEAAEIPEPEPFEVTVKVKDNAILTDGKTGFDGNWGTVGTGDVLLVTNTKCKEAPMVVTVIDEFDAAKKLIGYTIDLYHCAGVMIGYPEGKAALSVSMDGETWTDIGEFDLNAAELELKKYGTVSTKFEFDEVEAKFVKVVLKAGSNKDVLGDSPADAKIYWEFISIAEVKAEEAVPVELPSELLVSHLNLYNWKTFDIMLVTLENVKKVPNVSAGVDVAEYIMYVVENKSGHFVATQFVNDDTMNTMAPPEGGFLLFAHKSNRSYAGIADGGLVGKELVLKDFDLSANFAIDTQKDPAAAHIIEVKDYVEVTTKWGDVNGDGKVNAQDYMLLKRKVLGKATLTPEEKKAMDINKDGKVNAQDYGLLKRFVLKTYKPE